MKTKLILSVFFILSTFLRMRAGVIVTDSIYSGGIYRTYYLYVPTIYTGSTSVPLILNLHGYTSNSIQQLFYTNFMNIADTANFLIVHPQGTKDSINNNYWNAGWHSNGVNDVLFISQLIDSLKASYNIDNNCIYSTGFSMGGFMSNYLACNLSNKIAAIAPVAGTMLNYWSSSCNPNRPVPVLLIHGTLDSYYNGSSISISADSLLKIWQIKNNCNAIPSFSNVPDINTADGCTAQHYVYSGGDHGTSNEFYKVIGGAHTWPGATFNSGGGTCQDFSASVEIWRFFRKYKLNNLTSINEFFSSNSRIIIFPNPTATILEIQSVEKLNCDLLDINGNKINVRQISQNKLDISELENGIYFLSLYNNSIKEVKKIVKIN